MKNVQIDKISTTILDTKETSYFGFLTSQSICIFMCSSPLVGFIFLSLLHNLMLSFEQVSICKYLLRKFFSKILLSCIDDDIKKRIHFFTSVSKENFTLPLHGLSFKSGLHEAYGRKPLGCCFLFYSSTSYFGSKYDQQVVKEHVKIISIL